MGQNNFINPVDDPIIKGEDIDIPAEDPPEPEDPVIAEPNPEVQNAIIQFAFGTFGNQNEQSDPNAPIQILVLDLGAQVEEICQTIARWGMGDRRGFIRHEVENRNGRLVATRVYEGTDERVAPNQANESTTADQGQPESAPQTSVSNEENKDNKQ